MFSLLMKSLLPVIKKKKKKFKSLLMIKYLMFINLTRESPYSKISDNWNAVVSSSTICSCNQVGYILPHKCR